MSHTRSPLPEGLSGSRAGSWGNVRTREDAAERYPYNRPNDRNQAVAAYLNDLKLLEYTAEAHGFMAGFAKANLSGLIIDRITVFTKDGRKWCQLPAEPIRNAAGAYLDDSSGKKRYTSRLSWADRDLQQLWSDTLIELIQRKYGPIGGRQ
jgi:hypothetical protein